MACFFIDFQEQRDWSDWKETAEKSASKTQAEIQEGPVEKKEPGEFQ